MIRIINLFVTNLILSSVGSEKKCTATADMARLKAGLKDKEVLNF